MKIHILIKNSFYLILFLIIPEFLNANENKIIVASTTSTYDTGLLTHLNDIFTNKFNIEVQVISQGTGQALRTAKDGNVEVLLVHHKESELDFIKQNFGLSRYELMYNDFVIVGPKFDQKKCISIKKKLKEIFNDKQLFISRADDSGTHKKEIELWNSINLKFNESNNTNYLKVGQGMGNTLLIANEKFAYTISDRGTWISFKRKNNLKIICENQPPLFNQYGLILVNPNINKNLNFIGAKLYISWLLSDEAKNLINNFKIENKQLFFYNYNK